MAGKNYDVLGETVSVTVPDLVSIVTILPSISVSLFSLWLLGIYDFLSVFVSLENYSKLYQ